MCLIYFTLRDRSVLEGGGVPSKLSALQNISKMPMKEKKNRLMLHECHSLLRLLEGVETVPSVLSCFLNKKNCIKG